MEFAIYIFLYVLVTGYILESMSYEQKFLKKLKSIRILDGSLWIVLTIFFFTTWLENYYYG